ncbi:MAG: hypothetical protein WC806_04820 [Candidatus Gracilibacteria bacterium]|jgi:hypothetical protein
MHSEYYKGIEQANEEGNITWLNKGENNDGPTDFHSHFPDKKYTYEGNQEDGMLLISNTRPLEKGAKDLFSAILKTSQGSEIKAVEIGPGAGNALLEMRNLAESNGSNIELNSISITPTNPYLGLKMSAPEIRETINDQVNILIDEEYPKINPDVVLNTAKNVRDQIIETRDKPFIDQQYIGYFPENFNNDQDIWGKYDFVYMNRSVFNADEPPMKETCELLNPNGIVFIAPKFVDFRTSPRWEEWKKIISDNNCTICFSDDEDESPRDFLLIIKNDSKIGKNILEELAHAGRVNGASSTINIEILEKALKKM